MADAKAAVIGEKRECRPRMVVIVVGEDEMVNLADVSLVKIRKEAPSIASIDNRDRAPRLYDRGVALPHVKHGEDTPSNAHEAGPLNASHSE